MPLIDHDILLRDQIQECPPIVMFDEEVLALEAAAEGEAEAMAEQEVGGGVDMNPADMAASDVDSSEMVSAAE